MRSESDDGTVIGRNYNGFNWQTDYASTDVKLWFRYLPNGLRYSKQKRTDSTCTVTTHHWDGSDIVMDVSQNGTVKGRYLRGDGKLIAEDIAGSLSYYFFNAHGDIINRVNGSNGAVLKTYNYDSFGNIINPATVGDPNAPIYVDQSPFGYAGEYLDKENGEIYLRARYYNSEKGRFVTEDPAKYGSNWYSYCDNNPVNKVDRTGLIPTTDGSEGSYQYALDHMNDTYGEQQDSTHPQEEDNDTGSNKSDNSDKGYDDKFLNSIVKSFISSAINLWSSYVSEKISGLLEDIVEKWTWRFVVFTNPIRGFQLAPVSGTLPKFVTNADDIARSAAGAAKISAKIAGKVTGGVLDYFFQIATGENKKDAFVKTLLHIGVGAVVTAIGFTGMGALFFGSIGAFVVDKIYDNAGSIKNYFSKTFSFA